MNAAGAPRQHDGFREIRPISWVYTSPCAHFFSSFFFASISRHSEHKGDAEALITLRAVMVGSDTSGLEVGMDPAMKQYPNAVHEYLLVKQGVHIGEFHNLEGLAAAKVYRFVYFGTTNRVRGAVAGFALRPVAIE